MELSIKDRLMIDNFLPKESNVRTNLIIKGIVDKISLTEVEIDTYNIKTTYSDGKQFISYGNDAKGYKVDVDFTTLEKNEIKLAIDKISNEKKLPREATDLAILFGVNE